MGPAVNAPAVCMLLATLAVAMGDLTVQELTAGSQQGKLADKYKKWTAGVDGQITAAQKELATAHSYSKTAEDAVLKLRAREQKELGQLKMDKLKRPSGGHLSENDITNSFGRLIHAEQKDVSDKRVLIAQLNRYLGALQHARRKIVKSAMGVAGVEILEASQQKRIKGMEMQMYKLSKASSDKSYESFVKATEHALASQRIADAASEGNQAEQEVSEQVKVKQGGDENSEQGIIARIQAVSDKGIAKAESLAKGLEESSTANIGKFKRSEGKSRVKVNRIAAIAEKMMSTRNITAENEQKQAQADTEAVAKLVMQAPVRPRQPKGYRSEYEAWKMHLTAKGNQTEAAKGAQRDERIAQLKDWNDVHSAQEHKQMAEFVTKVELDHKGETELNNMRLRANEMRNKKNTLLKLEQLNKDTAKVKARVDQQVDAPLPKVPEEYMTQRDADGKELIARGKTISEINRKIHKAAISVNSIVLPPKMLSLHTARNGDIANGVHMLDDASEEITGSRVTPH